MCDNQFGLLTAQIASRHDERYHSRRKTLDGFCLGWVTPWIRYDSPRSQWLHAIWMGSTGCVFVLKLMRFIKEVRDLLLKEHGQVPLLPTFTMPPVDIPGPPGLRGSGMAIVLIENNHAYGAGTYMQCWRWWAALPPPGPNAMAHRIQTALTARRQVGQCGSSGRKGLGRGRGWRMWRSFLPHPSMV